MRCRKVRARLVAPRNRQVHNCAMAHRPRGFEFRLVDDEVLISHEGRRATTLRGAVAERFLADVERGDAQQLMARLTGNYKHGNERNAKSHPRNSRR